MHHGFDPTPTDPEAPSGVHPLVCPICHATAVEARHAVHALVGAYLAAWTARLGRRTDATLVRPSAADVLAAARRLGLVASEHDVAAGCEAAGLPLAGAPG